MDKAAVLGCIAWIFATPIMLSIIEKKLDWYVFSSYYGVAMLAGIMVQALYRNKAKQWVRIIAVTAVAALFLYGTISSYLDIEKIQSNESYRTMMADTLNREVDTGMHAYVQYSEQADGEFSRNGRPPIISTPSCTAAWTACPAAWTRSFRTANPR